MMENISFVKLKLYQCYFPYVKVFPIIYKDKNNREYFRAYFQDQNLNKVGFIVRDDFFNDWINFRIAEIDLKINEKGAGLNGYLTFESLKKVDNIKFIEVFGIYLKGEFTIRNPHTKLEEKIFFVPSHPNRSSMDPWGERGLFDCRITLRRFNIREVNHQNDPMKFNDTISTFFRIRKNDYPWQLDYDCNDPMEMEEDINSDMIFTSFEHFISSLNRDNHTELTDDNLVFEAIKIEENTARQKIAYLSKLKEIAQAKLGNNIKLEFESRSVTIGNTDFKILISNLNGYEFNRRYLSFGTETEIYRDNFGLLLDKENEKISCIEFSFILQI